MGDTQSYLHQAPRRYSAKGPRIWVLVLIALGLASLALLIQLGLFGYQLALWLL